MCAHKKFKGAILGKFVIFTLSQHKVFKCGLRECHIQMLMR